MSVFLGRTAIRSELLGERIGRGGTRRQLRLELGVERLDLLADGLRRLLGALDVSGLLHGAPRSARGRRGPADRRRGELLAPEERAEHRRSDRDGRLHSGLAPTAASRGPPPARRGAGAPRATPASPRTSAGACRRRRPALPARPAEAGRGNPPRSPPASRRLPPTGSSRARATSRDRARSRSPCPRPPPTCRSTAPPGSGEAGAGLRLLLEVLDAKSGSSPALQSSGRRRAPRRGETVSVDDTPLLASAKKTSASPSTPARYTSPSAGAPRGNEELRHSREAAPAAAPPAGRRRAADVRLCSPRPAPPSAHGIHQRLDLRARQRPAQVRHRPARLEHDRGILVDVVQQEHAASQRRERLLHLAAVELLRRAHGRRPRGLRARAPCRARSAAARGTRCRCWRAPCSRGPPDSASRARRRGRRRGPASGASAAAPSRAASRPAESTRRSRPCRGSPAGSSCPTGRASRPPSG